MTVLAALCLGLGIAFWLDANILSMVWIGLALIPGFLLHPSWPGTAGIIMGPLIFYAISSRKRSTREIRRQRQEIVRWWRALSIYLSAGLTFWQSTEEALQQVPSLTDDVRTLATTLSQRGSTQETLQNFSARHPGPEASIVAGMMVHGYRHGVEAALVAQQAEQMEDRLGFEEELERRKDPIWMTVLPAFLLLNVIAILFVPMMSMMLQSWKGL